MKNQSISQAGAITGMSSMEKVMFFWNNVWSAPYNTDLIDELMTEDFIITNGGRDIIGREQFKQWVKSFLKVVRDSKLQNLEIFESKDGTRVVSRWRFTGYNNGIFGLAPNQEPIELTGTAIWEIRDGKLAHNWVERSSYELYTTLTENVNR